MNACGLYWWMLCFTLLDKKTKQKQCRDREWNTAFNFSSDPAFLTTCMKETNGKDLYTYMPFGFAACNIMICMYEPSLFICRIHWAKHGNPQPREWPSYSHIACIVKIVSIFIVVPWITTPGDLPQRVCTAAEMKFYFESFLEGNGRKNYVRPNKNCNLTSWIDGCEPGWSCSAGKDQEVNLKDAVNIPSRTIDCRGCCAGFFCPHGLTCMIRK